MNEPAPILNTPTASASQPLSGADKPLAQAGEAPTSPFVVPEAPRKVERVPDTGPAKAVLTPPPTRPRTVHEAIADAARRSSVDYSYLVAQAELESGLNPAAKASTSTASGLFQFLETTWLATVKKHGPRFGYGAIADQIQLFSNGRPYVADRGQRNAILALRNDPQMAALMAAGFAEDNRAALEPVLGRAPDHGELYLAHFLGAGGARRFLTELQRNRSQSAASVFPEAAAANRPIFYDGNGVPRSLAGVMELLDNKMTRALARVDGGAGNARADGSFAPLTLAAASIANARSSAPASFTRASEAAYEPTSRPALAAGNPPGYSPAPGVRTPGIGPLRSSLSMSAMLRATFGGDGAPALASPQGAAQVRRAYDQLKAFGL